MKDVEANMQLANAKIDSYAEEAEQAQEMLDYGGKDGGSLSAIFNPLQWTRQKGIRRLADQNRRRAERRALPITRRAEILKARYQTFDTRKRT